MYCHLLDDSLSARDNKIFVFLYNLMSLCLCSPSSRFLQPFAPAVHLYPFLRQVTLSDVSCRPLGSSCAITTQCCPDNAGSVDGGSAVGCVSSQGEVLSTGYWVGGSGVCGRRRAGLRSFEQLLEVPLTPPSVRVAHGTGRPHGLHNSPERY
eukprot:GHVS01051820.1.p1 GENE.GHVS01051820.1~~GHVS01051820.1.p1  ORF type:complete len:152 (-),score=14.96 GHVS01051820.1:90-545(-)